MSESTIIRIHKATRPKINAIRLQKPAWTIQSIIDDAIEALAKSQSLDLTLRERTRKNAKSAA